MNTRLSLLEAEFRRHGLRTARELGAALGVSQPTISLFLKEMGEQIVRFGRARSVRYGLRRDIGAYGSAWPLYVIDAEGRARRVGLLQALEGRPWGLVQEAPWEALRGEEFPDGIYPDLPWFLDDLRPQGFLGRAFARAHGRALGLGLDPRLWSMDDTLAVLLRYGADLPGAFVLGEAMLETVLGRQIEPPESIRFATRVRGYTALAESLLAGEWPGSSAAGERPKFTAQVRDRQGEVSAVIVKFAGGPGAENRRWADLLRAEHLAAVVLREHGVAAVATDILEGEGRTFLESARFDREGARGRRGVVSLHALDAAFFGEIQTPWTAAAERLERAGWIGADDARELKLRYWFGTLIANNDMHYGNASLFLRSERPLTLAPSYDMLPMAYRPDPEGSLPHFQFRPPPPPPEAIGIWVEAAELAQHFWTQLGRLSGVSPDFRRVAKENAAIVARYRENFG